MRPRILLCCKYLSGCPDATSWRLFDLPDQLRIKVDLPKTLRIDLPEQIGVNLPETLSVQIQPPVAPTPGDSLPTPPNDVLQWCAQESDEWAREEMLQKAHRLHGEFGDWDKVLQELQQSEVGQVVQTGWGDDK